MIRQLEQNIVKLYIIKLAKWFMLIMPVVALYYTENGLSPYDVYVLQAIYSFSVACFEIPSGYLADVVGRKKSLIVGSILGTLGYIIYSIGSGFYFFLFAEIILGLGGSFISGSDSALLYDSLVSMRKGRKYLQLEGRITSIGNFAETLAAVGGGLLAAYFSYRSVYICQTFIAFSAIPASLLLFEPPRIKMSVKPGFKQIVKISKYAMFENKVLSSGIWLSSVIGTATLCMAWTAQVYFVSFNLNEKQITPLWVGLNLLVAVTAAYSYKLLEKIGFKKSVFLFIIFIPLGYLWLGVLPLNIAIATMFVFYAIRGYATPVLKDLINKNCDSDVRATVLSIRSLVIRIMFSLIGPFLGFVSGNFSITSAMIFAFIFFSISASISAFFYFMYQKR